MSYSTAVFGTVPENYFTKQNILNIINETSKILSKEYKQKIIVDENSVRRVLRRVFEEKLEPIERMNDRVIMILANNARNEITQRNTRMNFERNYEASQSLYDPIGMRSVDLKGIRLKQHLGKPKVGGTHQFIFM